MATRLRNGVRSRDMASDLRAYSNVPRASGTRARITGMLFADRELRCAHQQHHGEPGGYGQGRIYVAQLSAVSVKLEPR